MTNKDRERMPPERRRQLETTGEERARPELHLFFGRRRKDIENVGRFLMLLFAISTAIVGCTTAVMATMGYRFVGHGDDLALVTAQVDTLKGRTTTLENNQTSMMRTLEILRDAKCVELTRQQIALAQIDCRAVFARMRSNGG